MNVADQFPCRASGAFMRLSAIPSPASPTQSVDGARLNRRTFAMKKRAHSPTEPRCI
jgi:hypothetical protein